MTKHLFNAEFASLFERARKAAEAAVAETKPTPMVVRDADVLSGKPLAGGQSYFVSGGPCGFAWVSLRPATSAFAKWLKANKVGRPGYHGGLEISSRHFAAGEGPLCQSMELNEAAAYAAAKVLREAGFMAHAESRMD